MRGARLRRGGPFGFWEGSVNGGAIVESAVVCWFFVALVCELGDGRFDNVCVGFIEDFASVGSTKGRN